MSDPHFLSPMRRLQALLTMGLVIGATLCAASFAGAQSKNSKPKGNASDAGGPISVTVTTDKKTYMVGDPIKLTMTVRNTTKSPISLDFSSGQKYDFEIRRGPKADGALVWQWSHGMMFMQMLSRTSLAAGKTLSFNETFDPKAAAKTGSAVSMPAGAYTVVGTLTTMPRTARPSGTTTFNVK